MENHASQDHTDLSNASEDASATSRYHELLLYFERHIGQHYAAAMGTFVLIGASQDRYSGMDLDDFDIVSLGFTSDDEGCMAFIEMLDRFKSLHLIDLIPDPAGGPDDLLIITKVGQALWDRAMKRRRRRINT